jgi:hypothetical protein
MIPHWAVGLLEGLTAAGIVIAVVVVAAFLAYLAG